MPTNTSSSKTTKTVKAQPTQNNAELRKLIEQQGKQIQELQVMVQKIYRYIWWQRIWLVVKILIIAVPIILGILYLPPLLDNAIEPYRQLLDTSASVSGSQAEVERLLNDLAR